MEEGAVIRIFPPKTLCSSSALLSDRLSFSFLISLVLFVILKNKCASNHPCSQLSLRPLLISHNLLGDNYKHVLQWNSNDKQNNIIMVMTEFPINVLWWLILLPFHQQECVCFCNITVFTRPCYLAMRVNCTTSLRSKFLASLCSDFLSETQKLPQLRLRVGNVWAKLEAVRRFWVNTLLHCLKRKKISVVFYVSVLSPLVHGRNMVLAERCALLSAEILKSQGKYSDTATLLIKMTSEVRNIFTPVVCSNYSSCTIVTVNPDSCKLPSC